MDLNSRGVIRADSFDPSNDVDYIVADVRGEADKAAREHLCLPYERAAEICDLGWGEPHGYAGHGTEIMVYGPRDEAELKVVVRIFRESLAFARGDN